MFTRARLKLTAWYLLMIMVAGVLFSATIFRVVTHELEQGFVQAENHLRARERALRISAPPEIRVSLIEDFASARQKVLIWLVIINGFILFFSAALSFILAGKTLQPIARVLEEQKRFVTDASHELHTPLTALKISMEVALRDKNLTMNEVKQVLDESLQEIDELTRLSQNLLSLARQEQNGQNTILTRVDLVDVTDQVVKRLLPLAKKKEIQLQVNTTPAIVTIDEVSLDKLLTILVDNAIKYTPEKGMVNVTSEVTRKELVLRVVDTGVGIPKKDLEHIFDRFYRVDTSRTKEKISGFGLGLAIAKRLVDHQHGIMSVTSKVGRGTMFEVKLPLHA